MFTNKKYCYRINTDEHYGSYNLLSLEVGGGSSGHKKKRAREKETREGGCNASTEGPWKRSPPPLQLRGSRVWSVKSFDGKWLTSHKQSVLPKSIVHFIFGLNISVIKIS